MKFINHPDHFDFVLQLSVNPLLELQYLAGYFKFDFDLLYY